MAWRWRVEGGPCDELAARLESFELEGANSENATLTPRLSGDYRVTLSVTVPRKHPRSGSSGSTTSR